MEYLLVILPLCGWGVYIYNRLVRDKNRVLCAWSDIDVQPKRRHDLIPKPVEAVKSYSTFEASLLSEVTRLRSEGELAKTPVRSG